MTSRLHSIVKEGVLPLFTYWLEQESVPPKCLQGSEWANDLELTEYVRSKIGAEYVNRIDYEAREEGWSWDTLKSIEHDLMAATGLYRVILDGLYSHALLVDFVNFETITVLTIWGTIELRCQNFKRKLWIDLLLDLLINQSPEWYGRVALLRESDLKHDQFKGRLEFSLVTAEALR